MMLLPLSKSDTSTESAEPALLLRGTGAGLEIVIAEGASADDIGVELTARLEQSPGFFAGNQVIVRFDGSLPPGALARLDEVTARFELRIAEVSPAGTKPAVDTRAPTADDSEAPEPVSVAEGSAGQSSTSEASAPLSEDSAPLSEDSAPLAEMALESTAPVGAASEVDAQPPGDDGPRLVEGPIRSGVVLDAPGHLVIVGDVNPGAEIHARGNIMVLGRLRGVAHAAVGGEGGFIMALHLEPQQLRVGNLVARAADADSPGHSAEIAYACRGTIVVEQYRGRIPSDLKVA